MKVLVASLTVGLFLSGGQTLATKYTTERALKYEISSSMTMETTLVEMERDGEPVEAPGGRGGMKSETEYSEIHIDHVVALEDGKPSKVKRTFEKVGGSSSMTFGEESRDSAIESPFSGITLELTAAKDGIEVEVTEGKKPDGEGALEGHRLVSFLDGLLSDDAVEVDATWELEKEAITRAMRFDLRKVLYPRPERTGEAGGGGGGRRGGGGMRGGASSMLDDVDWKGTAKLISIDKEIDGVACSIIELKIEASGERELPAMRGGRGGAFGAEMALENTAKYEVHLTGTFAFANKEKRPVKLDLEGKMRIETNNEFSGGGGSMKIHSVQEGKLEVVVECSEEAAKSEKK
ncbi:MAG: hypothetical protein JNL28_14050 [Planctomycetes bacterium]|nr:hypothetical protein [Planctomycetota bacterium]